MPDGDTLRCTDGTRVRLLSIDTPELAQKPHGASARDALRAVAGRGTRLTLETDVRERDRYGRILAYAYDSDGRMLNEEMARAGYAVALVYPPNVRHEARIRAAVAEARAQGRGLWATDGFVCAPRDYRAGRCSGKGRR
ncbi:MAG: hypothetical protein AVDCRST_MAG68-3431 [uncultured Gemmatimonadetes bacterium]|uniref:TNase-like domain-containing protein n=1 Tax=uncultured Gemmatimonadota bacterium TaxID=203437 RepID=A0A6J4LNB8_9BACT|nr:MAG: hypothetical protein AVDCRST_MAG68-3431 [uncultured Gemmatimonadota bacterium]